MTKAAKATSKVEGEAGWTQATLGDFVATRTRGIVPNKTPDTTFELYSVPSLDTGAPEIVKGSEIGSNKQIVDEGTVLLCKINPRINRAWVVSSHTAHEKIASTEWITFPPNETFEPKYLAYYLKQDSIRDFLAANASGVGGSLMRVKPATLKNYPFPIAPLDQQKRIVAEIEKQFSRLDEAVANLKRVKANLKRYKAAVLKAAVEGRLVETEAELARREGRIYETGEQLLQRILETRRSQWQGKGKYKEPAAPDTTDLPELPEGWVWATLEQLCPTFVDSAHRTPKYGETGKPAIGPRDVVGGDLRLESARLVDDNEFAVQTKRHIPQSGDIVYSRELSLGWGAVVPEDATLCLSQGMCLFRPDDQVVLSYFMYSLNGPEVRRQATRGSTGSAHPHLNLGDIKAFIFSLPPQSEQHRIVAEVDRRLSLLRETEAQVDANLACAERLRQSILWAGFSDSLSLSNQ